MVYLKLLFCRYDEVCDYNFNDQKFSNATGHFTQLVWKESTQLGIGFAKGSFTFKGGHFDNCLFVVARYKKAGNTKGAFQQNVRKGKFVRPVACPEEGKRDKLFAKFNSKKKRKSVILY